MNKDSKENLIICPKCDGSGTKGIKLKCPNCLGYGSGLFFKNKFLFWGYSIGEATIKLRHIKKSINLFIDILSFIISLIGLLALGYWIFNTSASNINEAFLFWRTKHWLISLFWVGILADMFIYYRLSISESQKTKIKKIKPKKIKIPNNWTELARFSNKLDVSKSFSEETIRIIENAFKDAKKINATELKSEHLFYSLLKNTRVIEFFLRLNINIKDFSEKISRINLSSSDAENFKKVELSNEIKNIFISAYMDAYNFKQKKVEPINLILPAFLANPKLKEVFYDHGINKEKILNVIYWFRSNEELLKNYKIYKRMAKYKPGKNMDRAYTAVATLVLNHFSYDLTAMAKLGRLNFCVSREKEIENIFQSFEEGHRGIALVGEEGVGKETIIHKIAKLMVEEEVPNFLNDKRLIELDIARLVSGSSPAQAEERLLVIIDEIARAGNIVLYVKNIENLIGISSGTEGSLELSEVLAGALERKSLFCIASVSRSNYTKYIENTQLGNVMKTIKIEEPDNNNAIRMLETEISFVESKHKVYFTYNAIEEAVKLSRKYIHEKYLPEKAINLVKSVAVKISKKNINNKKLIMVTKNNIAEEVSSISGIPVSSITENEQEKLINLEKLIHERMVNQKEAVSIVASSLRRARVEMRENKRPIANFLFLGPTGVGKTELAKTVASVYFNSEKNMIRLDMSEYQHKDSVKKIIGDAQGAVGFLTEAVREKPFSLILLDELEKADPNILNLFLQVMDDGRLSDGSGRTIDFTNTIIIATSNLGALYIQNEIAKGEGNMDMEKVKNELVNKYLTKVLRVEFINRFDGIVVFKPLSIENIRDITRLMLNKTKKMLKEKGITLKASDEGVKKIAEAGYDPKMGARPLRRLIQDTIESKIANKILSGELARRDVVFINDNMEIEVEKGEKL